jgi:RHS repeat-associated protein
VVFAWHTKIQGYDAMGRPLDLRQRFKTDGVWGDATRTYKTERTYDLLGHVKTQTYPSGRVVTYNYDQAGRLGDKDAQNLAFTGNLGDGVTRSYSTEILYSPLGGMTTEKFGTDAALYNKTFYNSRGQAAEIRVGTYNATDNTWWNRGAIINHYSDSCWGSCGGSNSNTPMTDNNGNLKKQDVYIPSNDQITSYTTWWQQYNYDALNRLDWVREIVNGAEIWKQDFSYDRYGNRTIEQVATWGSGINKKNFRVNTANNRLGVPAGQTGTMSYDNAGNLTSDTYSAAAVTRAYDAENRMTSETQANNYVSGSYSYNADGQRVRRKVGSVETWQVYGIDGELLAEYAANAAAASPQKEYGYRNGQLLITAEAVAATRTNMALAANGATATAQNYTADVGGSHYRPADAIDGIRYAPTAPPPGDIHDFWRDEHGLPSWVQIDFNGPKTIDEIDVFTLRQDILTQADPSPTDTFNNYGITAFNVQYWTGSAWQTVPGGSITNNNLVWKKLTFTAVTTSKIRVVVNAAVDGIARICEVEAWTTAGSASATANINWLVADQLGTPRMVFDKAGSLAGTKRHDYLPFGEDIFAGTGSRSTAQGYQPSPNPNDGVRQKFTSKERDIETGLDFFGARYYGSTQGRFTSADPLLSSGSIYDPQTWNRYSYTLNNPLKYIDPLGLYEWDASLGGSATDDELKKRKGGQKIIDRRNDFRSALAKAASAGTSKSLNERQRGDINRAVKAYGTEGTANGVSVAFGKVSDGATAETGWSKDASGRVNAFTTDANLKVTANITVTFSGDINEGDVAHEGSHAADRQVLGSAVELALQGTDPNANIMNFPENITKYASEFRAYQVSSYVDQARGVPSGVWNRGWGEADRATAINHLLRTSRLYRLTPERPGARLYTEKDK